MSKILYNLTAVCCISNVFAYDNNETIAYDSGDEIRRLSGEIEELKMDVKNLKTEINSLKENVNKSEQAQISAKESAEELNMSPEDLIISASSLIDEGQQEKARNILFAFLNKNAGNIYCGMAEFYIGESYLSEKNYKDAAKTFLKSYKTNVKGSKAPEALYKLALCLKSLSKNNESDQIIDKLLNEYSDAPNDILLKAKKLKKK